MKYLLHKGSLVCREFRDCIRNWIRFPSKSLKLSEWRAYFSTQKKRAKKREKNWVFIQYKRRSTFDLSLFFKKNLFRRGFDFPLKWNPFLYLWWDEAISRLQRKSSSRCLKKIVKENKWYLHPAGSFMMTTGSASATARIGGWRRRYGWAVTDLPGR